MSQKNSISSSHSHTANCRCDYSYLRNRNTAKLQTETTNKAYYKPYQIQKQPVMEAPKPKIKHYDPEALQTSYKKEYVKPEIKRQDNALTSNPNSFKQSYMARKDKAPFYSQTEYKKSFEPKPIKVQKQPIYEYKPRQAKFQGQSSYKQQFTAKQNPDLLSSGQQLLTAQKAYESRPKAKFQGQSSYKQTFQSYNIKAQKQPQYKYQPKNTRFEGESSYKATYVPLPQSAYKSDIEHCPVHPDRVAIK